MAAESSFDVVSKVDRAEVDNAIQQTRKELQQRFDFKGTNATIEWSGDLTIEVRANAEQRLKAAIDVFKERCVKRQVSLKALTVGEPKPAAGSTFKSEIAVNQGIATEKAREIVKYVKGANLKAVQVAIQSDQLRVSAKSKDSLQEVIQLLKEKDFGIPLQFTNYR
ncbi:MAG: YajQ family cyclic di-GMP-binding protein [Actinomycetota bacterium]